MCENLRDENGCLPDGDGSCDAERLVLIAQKRAAEIAALGYPITPADQLPTEPKYSGPIAIDRLPNQGFPVDDSDRGVDPDLN